MERLEKHAGTCTYKHLSRGDRSDEVELGLLYLGVGFLQK